MGGQVYYCSLHNYKISILRLEGSKCSYNSLKVTTGKYTHNEVTFFVCPPSWITPCQSYVAIFNFHTCTCMTNEIAVNHPSCKYNDDLEKYIHMYIVGQGQHVRTHPNHCLEEYALCTLHDLYIVHVSWWQWINSLESYNAEMVMNTDWLTDITICRSAWLQLQINKRDISPGKQEETVDKYDIVF